MKFSRKIKTLSAIAAIIASAMVAQASMAAGVGGQTELRPPLNGATAIISSPYITPASSPTDVFEIKGSASKTVEILKVWISMYADNGGGTTANYAVYAIKRSTANSGGTSTSITPVPCDSADTITCTSKYYTANPTTGTTVGQIGAWNGPVNYNNAPATFTITEAPPHGKATTLNGTSQSYVINLGGNTIYSTGKMMINALVRER